MSLNSRLIGVYLPSFFVLSGMYANGTMSCVRVLCASCDKWIRLRPNSTFCSIPWDAHRKSCLAKKLYVIHFLYPFSKVSFRLTNLLAREIRRMRMRLMSVIISFRKILIFESLMRSGCCVIGTLIISDFSILLCLGPAFAPALLPPDYNYDHAHGYTLFCTNRCDQWLSVSPEDHLNAVQKWLHHRANCKVAPGTGTAPPLPPQGMNGHAVDRPSSSG